MSMPFDSHLYVCEHLQRIKRQCLGRSIRPPKKVSIPRLFEPIWLRQLSIVRYIYSEDSSCRCDFSAEYAALFCFGGSVFVSAQLVRRGK